MQQGVVAYHGALPPARLPPEPKQREKLDPRGGIGAVREDHLRLMGLSVMHAAVCFRRLRPAAAGGVPLALAQVGPGIGGAR